MTKTSKFTKFDVKNKKKNFNKNGYGEEEQLTMNDIKRDRYHKQYRNYDNALRSKNLDRLLSYDDE